MGLLQPAVDAELFGVVAFEAGKALEKIGALEADVLRMRSKMARLRAVARAAQKIPRNRVFATSRDLSLYDAVDALQPGDVEEGDDE